MLLTKKRIPVPVHGTFKWYIHTQHTTSQITTNTKTVQRRLHRVPLKAMDPLGMKQVLRAGALDIRADGLNEDSPPTPRNVKNRSPHAIERIVTATKYNRLQIGSPEASWKELEKSALLIYDSMVSLIHVASLLSTGDLTCNCLYPNSRLTDPISMSLLINPRKHQLGYSTPLIT